jgi:hypothetical protein
MPFYYQPSAVPLSPPLPESQTASYITYKERHIRPHAYRPFRIPKVKKETTAHDFITRLLSLGDHIPHGAFLPPPRARGPVGLKPAAAISRVDRPSTEESIETSTLPKLSLRRQRTIHPQSPATATSLGRGASCSSTASTIRPAPPEPKKATKASKPPPSLKILAPLPSIETIAVSPIKVTSSPSSSEDEEVITPQHGRDIELPSVHHEEISEQVLETEAKGIVTMPGTPLNIPPTPLDIPVDWDDLRQRWSPHKSVHGSAQDEGWCEEDDATYDATSGGALVEEEEEPPAPTHAYAAGGIAPSTRVSEIKLSSITSKDLGEYFLLEPMELQLHTQRASALFSEEGWPTTGAQAQGEAVRGPITSLTSGVGHKRCEPSPILDADALGSPSIRSPTVADFPLSPATSPHSSIWLNTSTSIEPLPKTALGPTTKSPTLPPSALKPQGQRKKRHGRLVSLDEAALVMRTVRFSCTLDPQFDFTKFGQRNGSAVSIDSRVVEEIVPNKESSLVAGGSFLNVLSPMTPTIPRK